MTYLDEVFAGNQVGGNSRVGVDAAVVIFGDKRRFTVRAKQLHDDIRRTAGIDDIAAVGTRRKLEEVFFADRANRLLSAILGVDLQIFCG